MRLGIDAGACLPPASARLPGVERLLVPALPPQKICGSPRDSVAICRVLALPAVGSAIGDVLRSDPQLLLGRHDSFELYFAMHAWAQLASNVAAG